MRMRVFSFAGVAACVWSGEAISIGSCSLASLGSLGEPESPRPETPWSRTSVAAVTAGTAAPPPSPSGIPPPYGTVELRRRRAANLCTAVALPHCELPPPYSSLGSPVARVWPPLVRHGYGQSLSSLAAFRSYAERAAGGFKYFKYLLRPQHYELFPKLASPQPKTNLLINEDNNIRTTLVGKDAGAMVTYLNEYGLLDNFIRLNGFRGTRRREVMQVARREMERQIAEGLPTQRLVVHALFKPVRWCVEWIDWLASPREKCFPCNQDNALQTLQAAEAFRQHIIDEGIMP